MNREEAEIHFLRLYHRKVKDLSAPERTRRYACRRFLEAELEKQPWEECSSSPMRVTLPSVLNTSIRNIGDARCIQCGAPVRLVAKVLHGDFAPLNLFCECISCHGGAEHVMFDYLDDGILSEVARATGSDVWTSPLMRIVLCDIASYVHEKPSTVARSPIYLIGKRGAPCDVHAVLSTIDTVMISDGLGYNKHSLTGGDYKRLIPTFCSQRLFCSMSTMYRNGELFPFAVGMRQRLLNVEVDYSIAPDWKPDPDLFSFRAVCG